MGYIAQGMDELTNMYNLKAMQVALYKSTFQMHKHTCIKQND